MKKEEKDKRGEEIPCQPIDENHRTTQKQGHGGAQI